MDFRAYPNWPLVVLAGLITLLTSCGEPEVQSEGLKAALANLDLWKREAAFRAEYHDRSGTMYPQVPKKEFDCVKSDFLQHIHHGDTVNNGAINTTGGSLPIQVDALQDLVDALSACANPGPIRHGVAVHYGLNANDTFSAVLQVECLSYDGSDSTYTFHSSPDCYRINGDGTLALKKNGMIDWMKRNEGGRNYWNKVVIKHDRGGRWAQFDSIYDARMVVYPYEGALEHLIDHNGLDSSRMLGLVPIAVPEYRDTLPDGTYVERGYFNGICWIAQGVKLDDSVHVGYPYRAKAADLGSPCPPNCPMRKFRFRDKGMIPRKECM